MLVKGQPLAERERASTVNGKRDRIGICFEIGEHELKPNRSESLAHLEEEDAFEVCLAYRTVSK